MVDTKKPLIVYKASAGSGKTFTLATEYIKLLVCNPVNYRSILAVTFTNKATEEMKTRILSQLYGIWKQLPDSQKYTMKVQQETELPIDTIRQRAGEALHLLLHNYNSFRVQTIDAFFQSVLRNLARELELTANLRIGLNGDQVEEMAVDQLINHLRHTDTMLQWLLRYIMDRINEDKGWSSNDEKKISFIHEIKHFGKTIFRDYYKEHRNELNEKIKEDGFYEQYMTTLRHICDEAKERMKTIASTFFDTLEQEGLHITDIKNGSRGVASFFSKINKGQFDPSILNTTALKATEAPENWYKKDHPRSEELHVLADQVLIPLLQYAMKERERQWRLYQSAHLTLCHLNNLRLLNSIEQKVKDIYEKENLFLLGNTQHLLHSLIQESDSPFIFEKIGAQLHHVMIDEFQDTSTIQWQNFKILMQECMSHVGSENLIVGDVKQSVYRWRSGDWRLLNNIEQQFSSNMMEIKPLQTNYRSERNIITFNNTFFTIAAQHEYDAISENNISGAQQLKDAYADVCQLIPDNREANGYVEIQLLTTTDYQERTLELLKENISMLLEQGVPQNKIAILVRNNNNIAIIANYFADQMPNINIVSDEAFRLDSSISVRLLINALHLLTHPTDNLTKAYLIKAYHCSILHKECSDAELLTRNLDPDTLLPEAYIKHQDELLMLPLYELVEKLYDIFELHRLKNQSAYICAFYDHLSKFTLDNSTGIDAFIETWEEELHKKTIQSDEFNGIRIMTIHKSKGLEFEHVLLPFCDWKLERSDTIWCEPDEEPFNKLPIVPIDYGEKKMMGTIYEKDYLNEHLQLSVDNLNLLYVAFTRACKNLFIIGKRKAKQSRSTLIEQVLPELQSKMETSTLNGMEDEQSDLFFSYGTLCLEQKQQDQVSDNVFLQPAEQLAIEMEYHDSITEFRQSNKSREFVKTLDEEILQQEYIKTGNVMHYVFSKIHTTADIADTLHQLEQEGILYDEETTASKIYDMLHKRLEDPYVREWFSDKWTLYNECSILFTNTEGHVCERRPDRVMTDGKRMVVVDFKFGKPRPEYQEQVKEYMNLLHKMGHQQVDGYLWYVYSNKIEPVR